jgi:thiamine kinase-like enzyme
MNSNLHNIILDNTGASNISKIELIQTLWSGYGQLNRVYLEQAHSDQTSVVIKLIQFPTNKDHPRGWNSNLSHLRKVKSYQVEMNFYNIYNQGIKHAYIPKFIASGVIDSRQYLILEDLLTKDFAPKIKISWREVQLCLKWLANFHAKYLIIEPKHLWPVGSYWHLATRPDELAALDDLALKKSAPLIDEMLNRAKYKTFVHGDAKLANFLFTNDEVAAVDFQYVGGGVGIKDVAYFLSSIYHEDELHNYESQCLDYYFNELTTITQNQELVIEWRALYPYAWADFYRFLKGWSPEHWKIHSYSELMKERVLQCL